MAVACQCDNCKKIIDKDDIRVHMIGYKITHNLTSRKMPKGYEITNPVDFCSFKCLSEWAIEQQYILDDYKEISKRYENKNKDNKVT